MKVNADIKAWRRQRHILYISTKSYNTIVRNSIIVQNKFNKQKHTEEYSKWKLCKYTNDIGLELYSM
jgi:hypothetical protein